VTQGFGLIEAWSIVRRTRKGGRMISGLGDPVGVALSCGFVKVRPVAQPGLFSHAKTAGAADLRAGAQALRTAATSGACRSRCCITSPGRPRPARLPRDAARDDRCQPLPDYLLEEEPGDILRVTPRDAVIEAAGRPLLAPATYEAARALLPGVDVYALEAEWRAWWVATGRPTLRAPDRAFLGWVKGKTR
jgi:hypothetical protein